MKKNTCSLLPGWASEIDAKMISLEGAQKCIHFAFEERMLTRVYAMCALLNLPSENFMKKSGMKEVNTFLHPDIPSDSTLQECILYEISKQDLHVSPE